MSLSQKISQGLYRRYAQLYVRSMRNFVMSVHFIAFVPGPDCIRSLATMGQNYVPH